MDGIYIQDKYHGLRDVTDPENPHVGGNLREGDPVSFAPRLYDWLVKRFSIRTMMDIGSGNGLVADNFSRLGVKSIAIDGCRPNCDLAVHPTIHWDMTKGPIYCPVDLIWCVEVLEHIEEQYVDHLLDTFSAAKYIYVTHALPGEEAHHHVNLQESKYWIELFDTRNLKLAWRDSMASRQIATVDGAEYIQRTGMLFVNWNK